MVSGFSFFLINCCDAYRTRGVEETGLGEKPNSSPIISYVTLGKLQISGSK